jgi:seryl-tRNA synthetase
MLDLKAIRENPEPFRAGMARRGRADDLDRAMALDTERRSLTARADDLRSIVNRGSKAAGAAGSQEERAKVIEEVRAASSELKEVEPKLADVEQRLDDLMAQLPNVPHESAPVGETDEDAVEVRKHGEPTEFDFEPRDHVEIGELLGGIDLERGARTSGSRFVYLEGQFVYLQFALMRYAIDTLVSHGFTPVIPPVLVRPEAMFGTGFLPGDESQIYFTRDDELCLVGTAEVPLASLHLGEIIDEADLPSRYVGYSSCFRREAGAAGKDTRGIFRVHQFDKVEMFSFTRPEDSWDEHEMLVGIEEEIVSGLDLPYRVVNIAAGDLGGSAAKKYDIEAWLPGQQRYRELTSCSNCTDYQARRLQARVRRADGRIETLHTLNGTASAIGRTIIAVVENHQRADGSVELPVALHQYLPERFRVLEPARSTAT